LVWKNEWIKLQANNACCSIRTLNHRVTCLVALLAVKISSWCGLASMYSLLLLWLGANLKYLYCYGFCTQKIPFHPSFHSILLSINVIKILYQNIVRATTTEDSTPGGMEVRYLLLMYNNNNIVTGGANRIESNWIRIESNLIRNRALFGTESQSHRNRIESESHRIESHLSSAPGDFLIHSHSFH
jgi:hypothetical protein